MSDTRSPSEARPPRMEALARLPVFYALTGKRVVLAGGGAAVAWKAELLRAAGAEVHVFAAQPGDELLFSRASLATVPADAERDLQSLIVNYPASSRLNDALLRLAQGH